MILSGGGGGGICESKLTDVKKNPSGVHREALISDKFHQALSCSF